jgi:hypothetical protein
VADDDDEQTEASAILWEQAKADVAWQDSSLDSLRNRAVALLSVGTLVGGLFGSRLPHGHLSSVNLLGLAAALVLFALSVVLAVMIAWPRTWYFSTDRAPVTDRVAEGTVSLVTVNLSLASRAERNWTENQRTMSNLYWLFAVLCGVVGLEVVAWSLAVI